MNVQGWALGLDEASLRSPADLLPAWQELVEVAFPAGEKPDLRVRITCFGTQMKTPWASCGA
jgi:hypothetical protein